MNKKVKFIWISDIHFKENYSDKSNFDTFKCKFYKKIKVILEQQYDIFYFLISGDIAYQGNTQQYNAFKRFILDCFNINTAFNDKIRVLFCPGNHDISHENLKTLYKNKLSYSNGGASTLIDFFKNRDPSSKVDVEKLFEAYTNSLSYSNNNDNSNFQSYLISDITEIVEVSERYIKTATEGYVIDHENKVIFIILNTAWFSFGSSVQEFLESTFDLKLDIEKKNLLELMHYSQEAGRLKTRINENGTTFPYDELEKKMNSSNDKDYCIITMMHHPPEFLDWEEINSYEYENTKLFNLLKKSHILLTGHVHPPRNVRYESIFEDVLHLRAPLFLAHDDSTKDSLFPQNGFVDFDIESCLNKEIKLTYHNINCIIKTDKPIDLEIEAKNIKLRLPKKSITNSYGIKDINPHKNGEKEIIINKLNFD